MSKPSYIAEVDELLGCLLDGAELSPSQAERLQQLLLENPELLDQFVITTALANDLQHVASLAVSSDGESKGIASSPHWSEQGAFIRGLGLSVLALAASFAIVTFSMRLLSQEAAVSSPVSAVRAEFVATVVSQEGWAQAATYPAGSRFPTGVFALERGVVQLQLDSGPNLLLEGPAELDIKSVSQAHLAFGKLVFRDDSGGDPFHLSTPWSELADLGTEYAVSVRGDDEEVHVFSGAVERTGISGGGNSPVELLKDGQAVRYRRNVAASAESLATAPEEFFRVVARKTSPPGQPGAAYEAFNYKDKTAMMRSRANGGWGWNGSWRRNMPNMTGHNMNDQALRVGESLAFGSDSAASVGGSLGYVGNWLTHRNLAKPIDLAANRVVYVSFLYRPDGMWKKGENGLKVLFSNPGEGVIEHRIAIALDAGRGVVRGALCGARKESPLPMADGSTYLVAAKIACSADNPDQLMLRIFQPGEPVSTHEPAIWSVVTPTIDSDDCFHMMSLEFNCEHEQRIDEIRIGNTWASITRPWAMNGELTRGEPVAAVGE
jgi:ferric-dicitrate binding protein FerR (iron transport regulator)